MNTIHIRNFLNAENLLILKDFSDQIRRKIPHVWYILYKWHFVCLSSFHHPKSWLSEIFLKSILFSDWPSSRHWFEIRVGQYTKGVICRYGHTYTVFNLKIQNNVIGVDSLCKYAIVLNTIFFKTRVSVIPRPVIYSCTMDLYYN